MEKGEKFIWWPINRATGNIETTHTHCGKVVTFIEKDILNSVWISMDDFPMCNDRDNVNRFLAELNELYSLNSKAWECKFCGVTVVANSSEEFDTSTEEELWGHIQSTHPDEFEEAQDWETDTMLEECYERIKIR